MQKFPMSIPEMAQSSPLQSSDGTVYIGKGHSHLYAIHAVLATIREFGGKNSSEFN